MAPRIDLKTVGPSRWKTVSAVVGVATLIKQHGAELHKLLESDWPRECLPDDKELVAALEAGKVQAITERDAALRVAALADDAKRKTSARMTEVRKKIVALKRQAEEDLACEKVLGKAGKQLAVQAVTAKAAKQVATANANAEAGLDRMETTFDGLATSLAMEAAAKVAAAERVVAQTKETAELAVAESAELAAAGVKDRVVELETQVRTARKRARIVEGKACAATRNLERVQVAEDDLKAERARVDELMEEAEADAVAREQVESMPTWRPVVGKGSGRGGQKYEWGTRVIIYSLLAMMCPASAVGAVIVAVVKRTAPWLNPVAPTVAAVREMRFELRLVEEVMAARRVASAHRVRQLGFDETTKFQDPSMVTSVLSEPKPGAKAEVVIMRAAYATGGGTSAHLVDAIEDKCFARLRDFLAGWEATCKEMHPDHKWTGPDPVRCGLQALGHGGAIQSDTCTPARCTKRLLAAEVARQVKEKHPDWGSLSDADQDAAVRVHCHDCWQHIRNIFLKAMSTAQSAHVKEKLSEELEAFSNWERMTTDFDQLLRATYKVCSYLLLTCTCTYMYLLTDYRLLTTDYRLLTNGY